MSGKRITVATRQSDIKNRKL